MARGQSTGYQANLDTSAGTGPVAPTAAPSATGGTQLPVGQTSTAGTDLMHMIFPVGSSPLPIHISGGSAQIPMQQPSAPVSVGNPSLQIPSQQPPAPTSMGNPSLVVPGAGKPGTPAAGVGGGNKFNPFLGISGGYRG